MVLICGTCDTEFDRPAEMGPPPTYCSAACRQKAYRARGGPSTQLNLNDLQPWQRDLIDLIVNAPEGMEIVINTPRTFTRGARCDTLAPAFETMMAEYEERT